MLAALYREVTGEEFAGESGRWLSLEPLNMLLAKLSNDESLKRLRQAFALSTRAILRLAEAEGVTIRLPAVELPGISDATASVVSPK
jgi:hypothetical protein